MVRKIFSAGLALALLLGVITSVQARENRSGRSNGGITVMDRGRGGGSNVRLNKVEGLVTAVNVATGQVAIRARNGVTVVVVAVATTKIERNDRHVPLSVIRIGDRGEAEFANNFVAAKIESVGR